MLNPNKSKTIKKNKKMNLRNKVQLIGYAGMNPEVKNLENGKKVAKVSMATNEVYSKSSGERVTDTQWHNLIAWGKTAEIAEKYLKKGCEVAVTGKLVNRAFTDKDGIKRHVTEIVVNELLISGK
jgi:single-strand DNA-binding protein